MKDPMEVAYNSLIALLIISILYTMLIFTIIFIGAK